MWSDYEQAFLGGLAKKRLADQALRWPGLLAQVVQLPGQRSAFQLADVRHRVAFPFHRPRHIASATTGT